jgi:hypothetical protein
MSQNTRTNSHPSPVAPTVKEFFDPATWTLTYVVYDPKSLDAV